MSFNGYKRSIKLGFDYNEVKEGIPNVKKQMAVLNAEFKKSSEEAKASGKEIDNLGVKYDFLSNKLKIQEKEVDNYRQQLEKAQSAQGNNAKAVQNATTSLEIAEAKLGQTRAQLEQVTKELEKNKSILGKTAEEWKTLGDKTGEIGQSMTTKLTLPILAAGAAIFKIGADFEDALGKTDAVFKQNAKEITDWAEGAYKNFGLARTTALDMANSFGALASGMGLSDDLTKKYSKSLTELTKDMVAFHGGKLDVAQTALNSIFTGETESLKKYGIVMTQANLQQFAYSNGIRKKISDMTEAEKVQLRYDYVMEKSVDVIGQYKREQGNANTTLSDFQEGLVELGASFSDKVLPIFTPFIDWLKNLIDKFTSLSDGTKKFIVTIAGIVAIAGPILLVLSNVFKAISNISNGIAAVPNIIGNLGKTGQAFSGLLGNTAFFGFAKWAIIIAGVALAVGYLIKQINILIGRGKEAQKGLDTELEDMTNKINGAVRGSTVRGYAVGTSYHPGGVAMVGEEGPELINLPRGTRVRTAQETKSMLGETFNLTLNVNMDEVDDVSKLVRIAKEFKQTKRAGIVGI